MRRLALAPLVLVAALLTGCATATVGTIDMREPLDPIRGRTLLIVPLPTTFGGPATGLSAAFGGERADTLRVAEFVPLDSLGAASYARYAEGAVAEVLREVVAEDGAWTAVTVGSLPDGLAVVEQTYSVRTKSPWGNRPRTRRVPLDAPEPGAADRFGPGVDYVLFVQDAGLAFAPGGATGGGPVVPIPGIPGGGAIGGYGRSDDGILLRADLVLWDDAAGTVVSYGSVSGFAPIRSRMVSAASERTPSALVETARDELAEAVADAFPGLVVEE